MLYDRHVVPFGPNRQLLRCSGAERIAGGQHDLFPLLGVILGQLADSRRLADAVDADDEDDLRRPRPIRHGLGVFLQQLDNAFFQIRNDVVSVANLFRFDAFSDFTQQVIRRFDTDIAGQHDRFQILVHFVVDLGVAADDRFNILNK